MITKMIGICNQKLKSPFVLAPMAAVNCQAFRRMCFEYGAGLVYTGMIDADELASEPEKSRKKYFDFLPMPEELVAVQLIGGKKDSLAVAAQLLSEEKNVRILDFNAGCILGEWLGRKAGAYLVKHPEILEKLLSVIVENSKVPVTCKIRIGWNEPNHKIIAKIVENSGAAAIAVHARTKKQDYSSTAKWAAIREVKEIVNIPVIGNGDVNSPLKARQMLGQTKCDAVMIGRWAIGNPYCFKQLADYFGYSDSGKKNEVEKNEIKNDIGNKETKNYYSPNESEKKKEFLKFMEYYSDQPRQKLSEIKQHAKWFMKETKTKKEFLKKIDSCNNKDELVGLFS